MLMPVIKQRAMASLYAAGACMRVDSLPPSLFAGFDLLFLTFPSRFCAGNIAAAQLVCEESINFQLLSTAEKVRLFLSISVIFPAFSLNFCEFSSEEMWRDTLFLANFKREAGGILIKF